MWRKFEGSEIDVHVYYSGLTVATLYTQNWAEKSKRILNVISQFFSVSGLE